MEALFITEGFILRKKLMLDVKILNKGSETFVVGEIAQHIENGLTYMVVSIDEEHSHIFTGFLFTSSSPRLVQYLHMSDFVLFSGQVVLKNK